VLLVEVHVKQYKKLDKNILRKATRRILEHWKYLNGMKFGFVAMHLMVIVNARELLIMASLTLLIQVNFLKV